jgi:hypothetical protein
VYKIRVITYNPSNVVYGVTIPNEIAVFFSGCYFKIDKFKEGIILTSGCIIEPTKEDLKKFEKEIYDSHNIKR